MGIYLLYFILIISANTIGAISGMGGGVIIKPVLDTVAFHSLAAISFYSSVAVFTMSISSTLRQVRNGIEIHWSQALWLSVGSMLGGLSGHKLFDFLLSYFPTVASVQLIQIILTIFSLVLVLIYTLRLEKTFALKSLWAFLGAGFFLGSFSTLLGIGGGPINVSLLVFCFGLTIKEATVYSIITIFFSQLARLVGIALTTGFGVYDLSILGVIIPAALIGGYLGGLLSGKMSPKRVTRLFTWTVLLVIIINLFNGLRLFF